MAGSGGSSASARTSKACVLMGSILPPSCHLTGFQFSLGNKDGQTVRPRAVQKKRNFRLSFHLFSNITQPSTQPSFRDANYTYISKSCLAAWIYGNISASQPVYGCVCGWLTPTRANRVYLHPFITLLYSSDSYLTFFFFVSSREGMNTIPESLKADHVGIDNYVTGQN